MKKALTIFICAFYLVLVAGSGSASVLCFGNDGHVAIELDRDGACDDSGHESSNSQDCELLESEPHCHCGPCVDIPLSYELVESRPVTIESLSFQTETLLSIPLEANAPSFLELATVVTLPIPPPISISLTLLSLRTIVLLV